MIIDAPHRSIQVRATVQVLLWRRGWWGPLAVSALLAAAAIWQFELRPTAHQIEHAEATLRSPRLAPAPKPVDTSAATDKQRLDAFRAVLKPYLEHTQIVRHVLATTGQELQWEQAEFQQTRDSGLGIVRLQISAPVSGDYRRLRRGLERALREVPSLSLDHVSFRREQGSQAQLEARLKLSLWLLAAPGVEPIDAEAPARAR
jgi:hypothetical protein